MTTIRVISDRDGQTLTIWFGDPEEEHLCDERDGVILMKDRSGRVIGLEALHVGAAPGQQLRILFETIL